MTRPGPENSLFVITVLLAWTLMHLYAFWRISSVPLVARRLPRWLLIAVAAFLWISFLLARLLDHAGVAGVARVYEYAGATWIGILVITCAILLIADIITGFGYFLPRMAGSLRGWALLASGVLCVFAMGNALRPPVVRNYEVRLPGLPAERDGTVLVVGSDFHLGTLLGKDWLAARIAQIEALRPDLVILAGDIIEGDNPSEEELIPVLRRLSAPLGVWAVTGNHEFHGGRERSGRNLLEETGFRVLHDRWAEAQPGLLISGVDDLSSRHQRGQDGEGIERALAGRPAGAATILVSHIPWEAERAAAAGVGLMLAAHTHGGQIWPWGLLLGIRYPRMGGRYDIGGMPLIVCRGTGTWGPRMRLWRPSEILRITLRSRG